MTKVGDRVEDIDPIAVRNAVEDLLKEAEDYRYNMGETCTANLDELTEAFDDEANDDRLIQAAQAFLPDAVYFEGLDARLDDAIHLLRVALEAE